MLFAFIVIEEVTKLAKENGYGYWLLVNGYLRTFAGSRNFTFADEDGISLSDVAKLDTMVTVDAVNFVKIASS